MLEKPILHLFNTVTILQTFPTLWNKGLIIPIFKKGDGFNSDNYHGMVISRFAGKLYLKILTKRTDDYSGLWSQNQCGFKKDHRVEAILYVLNSIYESYMVNRNKNKWLAFVDFFKWFYMINRKLLFYKVPKYGITGYEYHTIKSIYDDTRYRVKIRDRYSLSFKGRSGVQQGSSRSPIFSNMYQNDLLSIFTEGCDPFN